MNEKEIKDKNDAKDARTTLVWIGIVGWIIARVVIGGNVGVGLIICTLALGATLHGCYYWAEYKGRHWAFMFWGILAPLGFLGLSSLKDKNIDESNPSSPEVKE